MGRPRGSRNGIRSGNDKRIASGELAPKDVVLKEEGEKPETFAVQVKRPVEDTGVLTGIEDLLDTPFYTLNKMVPAFRSELISMDPKDWYVKWFFPNAEGGPIYVDYPQGKHDLAICRRKAQIMERMGLNYKVFRPDADTQLQSAMEVMSDPEELT